MPILTHAITQKYIKDMRLAPPPARRRGPGEAPIELKDTDAQALVVGSGLVVAGETVPSQTRQDLINSTLFAQLAARGSVTDPSKVTDWYNVYFQTLTALGWAQSDSRFEEFKSSGHQLEAHKSILKVLATLLGPGAAAVALVIQTFEALQSMDENSPWIKLFDHESMYMKSARFQVATAQRGDGGLLEIALVAFELSSKVSLTRVLFFKFKSRSTNLKYASGRATIYEEVLAQQRGLIAERLAAYRSAYIGQVRLPPPPSEAARPIRGATPGSGRSRSRGRGVIDAH